MSIYWNALIRSLTPYVPGEQPRDRRYIKLNTNENPYPPSPKSLEAIRQALESLKLYPDPQCRELREAIARRWSTSAERVFVGNGSDEILAFAFGAFFPSRAATAWSTSISQANPGELPPIIFPDISYSFYPVYADLWQLKYQTIPLRADFSINPSDYHTRAAGVILANPNAPTGRALSGSEVLSIVEYQACFNRLVMVDEAYIDFGGESVTAAVENHPNLLVVHTLSKSRSLAGLRVGYAIGQEPLIEGLNRLKNSFNSYTLDRLALVGATAAIDDTAYYEAINAKVVTTRDQTARRLSDLGFMVIPSKANFLFVSHPALPGSLLFKALRDRGILVRHFDKPRIENFLRISIGSDDDMASLIKACTEILAKLTGFT